MSFVFATPKVKSVDYGNFTFDNDPINLMLVKSISKSNYAHYPDNKGKPSIKFNGIGEEWIFDTEQERDDEFSILLNTRK